MSYSTASMVRLALAPTDGDEPDPDNPTNTAADLDDTVLDDAIAEADALIDSYLGARYATPVAPVGSPPACPHPLDFWSRNIAAYNATLTLRGSLDFTDNDPIARRWAMTMTALTAVRDGKATLALPPIDSGSPGAGAGAGEPINAYSGVLFTQDDFDLTAMPPGWPLGQGYAAGYWPWDR